MKKLSAAAVVAVLAAAGLWAWAADDASGKAETAAGVKVTAVGITEMRQKELVKGDADTVTVAAEQLTVSLTIEGDALAGIKRLGRVKVTAAKDDAGTDLLLPAGEGVPMMTVETAPGEKPGPLPVSVELKASARKAANIATLTGTVTALAGGKEEAVVIKDIRSFTGKPVTDAALDKAGVKLSVPAPKEDEEKDPKSIGYELSGNADLVMSIEVVTSTGQEIPGMDMSSPGEGKITGTITTEKNIPAKAGLKVTVLSGAKTLTIPFDLKNIPLP